MQQILTPEQTARIIGEIIETNRQLDKPMRFTPLDEKDALIAFYKKHLIKLNKMLTDGVWNPKDV